MKYNQYYNKDTMNDSPAIRWATSLYIVIEPL